MDSDLLPRLLYILLLLAALGGWMLTEFRARLGQTLRMLMAWGMILLGLVAGYGLWSDVRPQLLSVQQVQGDRIEVTRDGDGHFHLTLNISGTPVRFMVDTGASNVVLSNRDAGRLGVDASQLAFVGRAATANGIIRTARVMLSDVQLGDFRDARLPAYVTDGDMDVSLLGMDYLRLYRIEIDGNRMILTRRG